MKRWWDYDDSAEYAYSVIPKNEKFDIPLAGALAFWAVVILVIAFLASCTLDTPRTFADQTRTIAEQHRATFGMGPQ